MTDYRALILATPNLAAYWRLGESSGTVVDDLGPNGIDLTYTNNPGLGAAGLLRGDPDSSVDFDGSTHYAVRTTHALLQGGSALSVECWAKIDTTGNRCPVGFYGSSTDKGYWINLTDPLGFFISNDGSAQISVTAVSATDTATLYHIVGTYDGNQSQIYVNGVLENTNTAPSGAIRTVVTANSFAIGRLGALSSDYADGRIDEVAIYNRVLTPTEIAAHYTAGITKSTPVFVSGGSTHTVRIADEAWFNPFTLQASSCVASEGINDLGRFSCIVQSDAAVEKSRDQWIGKWLRWADESFGVWGGVIDSIDPRPDERTWEIAAVGFGIILDWRATPIRYKRQSAPAGALVKRAFSDANADYPTWIADFLTDESGAPTLWEWRGDTVLETMRTLASQTQEEWFVSYEETPTTFGHAVFGQPMGVRKGTSVVARWARQITLDGFARTLLHETTHQAGIQAPLFGGEIINDIRAIGNDRDIARAARMRLVHTGSREKYGTRSLTKRYSDVTTPSALQWRGRTDLNAMANPRAPITIDLARTNPIAKKFKVGSIAYLMSSTLDYSGLIRILGRSLDVDAGILTLAGRRYP